MTGGSLFPFRCVQSSHVSVSDNYLCLGNVVCGHRSLRITRAVSGEKV